MQIYSKFSSCDWTMTYLKQRPYTCFFSPPILCCQGVLLCWSFGCQQILSYFTENDHIAYTDLLKKNSMQSYVIDIQSWSAVEVAVKCTHGNPLVFFRLHWISHCHVVIELRIDLLHVVFPYSHAAVPRPFTQSTLRPDYTWLRVGGSL